MMSFWEEQFMVVLDAFLRLASASSCLPPLFRAALLQSEQPQALLSNVPSSLLSQALYFCSAEAESSCKEGVSAQPLYKQIARALCEWMRSSTFPRALESIPGLLEEEEEGLEAKVEAWAEKILQLLAGLQELIQGVKLHLQVQEPLFSELRERSPDALVVVEVAESLAAKHATTIESLNRSSTSVLLGENLCNQNLVDTVPAIHMRGMPEIKQPLKVVETILEVLGIDGVKALLGFRSTIGSIRDALPPSRSLLLASFLEANRAEVPG